jgi:hypothetical protein
MCYETASIHRVERRRRRDCREPAWQLTDLMRPEVNLERRG